MAYADPQSVTIATVANTLPRTGSGPNNGAFTRADGLLKLSVSHAYNKRTRRTIRLDHSKIAADPFLADVSARYSMSTYIVVDHPTVGYTNVELQDIVLGLTSYLSATSGARTAQLLGGES